MLRRILGYMGCSERYAGPYHFRAPCREMRGMSHVERLAAIDPVVLAADITGPGRAFRSTAVRYQAPIMYNTAVAPYQSPIAGYDVRPTNLPNLIDPSLYRGERK